MGEKYAINVLWSDARCYEVVRWIYERCAEVRLMHQEIVNREEVMATFKPCGFVGHVENGLQRWSFEPNESATVIRIRKGKKGWRNPKLGDFVVSDTPWARYDFNF